MSRFLYGRGELGPDAMERAGTTYLLLKDERGSIRFVVDATAGTVAQALEYDAFGHVLSDSAPGFQPFGFAGGIYDADTAPLLIARDQHRPYRVAIAGGRVFWTNRFAAGTVQSAPLR